MEIQSTIANYSLFHSRLTQVKDEFDLSDLTISQYFTVLPLLFDLDDDDIQDTVTDTSFLKASGQSGHDRGIDAVYIDDSNSKVHLCNFKYAASFDKSKSHFPSGEVEKILNFLDSVQRQDHALSQEINPVLMGKVKDIWEMYESGQTPKISVHIVGNFFEGLITDERKRFEKELKNRGVCYEYNLMEFLVNSLINQNRQKINAKIKAIDMRHFVKSEGDIRALIANFDARDIIRIVLDDKTIRNTVDLSSYSSLAEHAIAEDAFEDNVRVYKKQKTNINRNIKATALGTEKPRFFYFNNGITITCEKFEFPPNVRSPTVELTDLQVVNGSQTIHSLFDAFKEEISLNQSTDPLNGIEILGRIYETHSPDLTSRIAEYTNSQNPVGSRDIRSIDYVQQRLETELKDKGYFYERKKEQHVGQKKDRRIDAEKLGQALMAFYQEKPFEAKERKQTIFGEEYEKIFNDSLTAEKALLAYLLYRRIEQEKRKVARTWVADADAYAKNSFLIYSSFYLLYIIGRLAERSGSKSKLDAIWQLYPRAVELLRKAINRERRVAKANYTHSNFLKSTNAKRACDTLLASLKKV